VKDLREAIFLARHRAPVVERHESEISKRRLRRIAPSRGDFYSAKSQVYSRSALARFLSDSVLPMALRFAFHHQKAARFKFQLYRSKKLVCVVLQDHGALFTQTQRRYHGSFPQLWFIIAMESHAISIVAIVIKKHAVELCRNHGFDAASNI